MLIIGAGWGRTGTTSLTAALEQLGAGPCLHMRRMWDLPEIVEQVMNHLDGRRVDWAAVTSGVNSTTDWPFCWVWRELAEAYPDAPVLLSVRDPESWYESVLRTVHAATGPGRDVGPPFMRNLLDKMWQVDFGGWERVLDRDHAIACFRAHNDEVRRDCPPGRLVEWQVADGWGSLCEALDVPAPDDPFPHLNTRAEFRAQADVEDR